ncbi:cytochrome P450 [Coniophora puteana RWD-64-598 SS2]|uniref:Cytochrome P450 n=1 Tax=Coniophora puteana (strain RWD-64-598) TaxID=741705 RepID=A0A5M3N2M7_CONPW|nr:cytochrome P450 [Coniophora puteana RWD-64-598 SS2]EIW85639.1 cytochrome P450 [Coniophora puteana RWD-64-598 SS2]
METPSQSTLALLGVAALSIALYSNTQRKKRDQLPPSLPQQFFLGNMKDFPSKGEMWVEHRDIAQKLDSDWVNFNMMGNNMLVLNSYQAANELLDKRGAVYSGRPRLVMLNELIGWDWNLSLMDAEKPHFVSYRRVLSQQFQPSAVAESYHPLIRPEVVVMLKNILDRPEDFRQLIKHMTSSLILMIVYGHRTSPNEDRFVKIMEDARDDSIVASEKYSFVDFFPFLKHLPEWLPGAGFKKLKFAREARSVSTAARREPYLTVKERLVAGTAKSCMMTTLLDDDSLKTSGLDREELIMDCTSALYGAGVDTTSVSLSTFVLCMLKNPEVQRRAQKELDSVTGGTRLPEYADRPNLPYIESILKESLRWLPVAPLGVPHRVFKDDTYRDKLIPKNTTVFANIWAMMYDPEVYASPKLFMPERFIANAGKGAEPDPKRAVFGFGRRVCPGMHLADATMWLSVAMVLATFDILAPTDGSVERPVEVTSTFTAAPPEFKCVFKPRSEAAMKLVRMEV